MPSIALHRTRTCLEHMENLKKLTEQLRTAFPQVADEAHPAHAMLKRAKDAEEDQRWETAFNEIFAAQEALSSTSSSTSACTSSGLSSAPEQTVSTHPLAPHLAASP